MKTDQKSHQTPGNSSQKALKSPGLIAVDRLIAEIRSGRVAAIRAGRSFILAIPVEALTEKIAGDLQRVARRTPRLVLPAPRLRRLGFERQKPGVIAAPHVDIERLETLSMEQGARFDAPVANASKLDEAALELVHLALVHPSVLVVPVSASNLAEFDPLTADANDILSYRAEQSTGLELISRAIVPLEDANNSEFVVFRGGEGMRDQVAIIVGEPDLSEPVTVRLHSACLTGDLFGSLKCDCGDQLRSTIKFMSENGGGMLLYLDQEGRGNGLSNKIRAYRLQASGLDTYDADEVIGFDHDQRLFDFAAGMLHQLGVKSVRIMTNNPNKIEALKTAGLDVVAEQRIEGRLNDFNVRYLSTKRDRAGHYLTLEDPGDDESAPDTRKGQD